MTKGGLLTLRDRLYIPNCDDLKSFIMDELHKRPYTGHPGYQKMITTTRKQFLLAWIEERHNQIFGLMHRVTID
jgi:hypothetical protein